MLAEGSIRGVNFGDELCWSCLPYNNLTAAVDLVRRDLPRGTAILYYNEAYPVFSKGICQLASGRAAKLGYPGVPQGLDWISIDYCEHLGRIKRNAFPWHQCHLLQLCSRLPVRITSLQTLAMVQSWARHDSTMSTCIRRCNPISTHYTCHLRSQVVTTAPTMSTRFAALQIRTMRRIQDQIQPASTCEVFSVYSVFAQCDRGHTCSMRPYLTSISCSRLHNWLTHDRYVLPGSLLAVPAWT
eukprot:SAG31_NODE_7652_length_1629_cov_1.811765_1_plen_242_part_00